MSSSSWAEINIIVFCTQNGEDQSQSIPETERIGEGHSQPIAETESRNGEGQSQTIAETESRIGEGQSQTIAETESRIGEGQSQTIPETENRIIDTSTFGGKCTDVMLSSMMKNEKGAELNVQYRVYFW